MKYLKISLIHLLLAFSNLLLAQQYPVNVSSNLVIPMPSKLSNFYADNVQKFFVTLTNKDLTNPSIPVKLKLTLIGSSVQIVSRVGSEIGVPPILLDAGVPQTLTQEDLAPYFNINNVDFVGGFSKSQYSTTGVLPEGNYAVSVQVLDYYNNRPLSKPFGVYGSVFFSQPPILLLPQSNNTINGQQTTVIPFNWVPSHLNNRDVVTGGYKYIFTLKEILNPNLNINQAYATATTRLVEEVSTTQFMLNTLITPLLSGRKYAWTVQVKANNPEAQYTLANNGISQVWGFTYDDNCQMPTNISSRIQSNNLSISWTNSTFGKVSSVRYKEVNGVEYEKQLIQDAVTVSLDGLLHGKSYEYSLVVKCGTNTLVTNPRFFTVPPKSSAVKATLDSKVYWSVQEGQKSSDYTATGFDLKTIFQGTSTQTIKALIPNHKLGLSVESNDATVTLNACVGTAANQKVLKGAKVELWENEALIESSTTDVEGAYKIAIDTGRIIDNSSAKYYLKFSRPDNLMGRDSINLSGLRTGKDILNKVKGKLIKLFSSDYLVIHPVVYVGVNQVAALQKKAGGKVEVFIHTNDSKSLPNRILGYVENIPTNESYNGESYILIGTLDDVNAFLPIETLNKDRESLLFKVSLKGYPTQYYAIKTLPDNLQSQIVNIPLDYNPMVKIQGKVYKNVQKDLEGLNKSAVIAYDNTAQKVLDGTTTNSDGTYVLPSVPFSQVQNLAFYAAPFNESTKVIDQKFTTPNYNLSAATAQNNPITQDMNYGKTPVDIVYGQALLAETGKAVANAIIYYDDARIGQTSEDGFFAFKMSIAQKDPKNFKIVCNGKVLDPNQTISIVETAFSKWAQQVQPNAYNKANLNKNKPNSALLNHFVTYAKQYDDRNARTISILVDTTLEKLGNYYLANCTLKYTFYNKLMATYRGVKQTVLVKDLEENVIVPMNMADTTLLLSPDIDRYQVSISPAPNQTPFVEIKNSVINFSPSTPSVIVILTPLVKITGTITAKLSNKVLDSATIKVDRLDAQALSNGEGVFQVVFGETSEAKLTISREGYFAKDTIVKLDNASNKTVNIQLEAAPGIPIGQLAGFDAEITRQLYIKDSTYKVWGRIQLNPNGIFSLDGNATSLTFNNILVHVGQDGNARPLVDSLTFTESQVNGKMFDFAPIDIRKIQLKKKLEVREFSRGVITGLVTVKASTFPSINKSFPLTFGDATLQVPDKFTYIYLFTSDKQKISALDEESMAFYLKFDQADQGYVKSPFLKTGRINVSQDSCVIAKNGMSLKGNITLPNTIFTTNSNLSFKDLQIDNQLNFTDHEINLSSAPLTVGVKKWRLSIEKIKFNLQEKSLGLGGKLHLTKKNAEGKNVLAIKTFEIKGNDGGGVDVITLFIRPSKGISIKNLTFTLANEEIELPYTEAEGFSLKCAGTLTTTDIKPDLRNVIGKIFPLEVDNFMINSKNWGISLSLKPNTLFDFKGIKIAGSQPIMTAGTDISVDKMKTYLAGTPQELSASPDELDDADIKTGWAIGMQAAVAFEKEEVRLGTFGDEEVNVNVKSTCTATTSFVVGSFNNTVDIKIAPIYVVLRTPAINLNALVEFKLTGDTIGVSGKASKLKTNGISLGDAYFYYYTIANTNLVFGGRLAKEAKKIPMGPITWYTLNLGFDYNQNQRSMEAYFSGKVGPKGSRWILGEPWPRTRVFFDIERLEIKFTGNCGDYPVLKGDAKVFMKKTKTEFLEIGAMRAEIDFCKNILLVAIKAQINGLIPDVQANVDGILYAVGNSGDEEGALLLVVDGQIKVGSFFDAFGHIALGVNFDASRSGIPREVIDIFNKVPYRAKYDGNKMNAFYVNVASHFDSKNDIGLDAGFIKVGVKYYISIGNNAHFLANYGTDRYEVGLGVAFTLRGAIYGSLDLGFVEIKKEEGFGVDGHAELTGGYSDYDGLYVSGGARLAASMWSGSCEPNCNRGCLLGLKVCLGLNASLSWSLKRGFGFGGVSIDLD